MRRFPVIILAGGERGPLIEATGFSSKAQIPICGKAMVEWVIDAFRQSPSAGEIVVVGPSSLDRLPSLALARTRVPSGGHILSNLLRGITYVKLTQHRGRRHHEGYVISSCDSVFLTPPVIEETLEAVAASDADLFMTFVERRVFEEAGLPAEHTYYAVGNRLFTGAAIYYIRSVRKILRILPTWIRLRRHRKDGPRILQILGCQGETPEEVARALQKRYSLKVDFFLSPNAEMGMDVDKPTDLAFARERMASSERVQEPRGYEGGINPNQEDPPWPVAQH